MRSTIPKKRRITFKPAKNCYSVLLIASSNKKKDKGNGPKTNIANALTKEPESTIFPKLISRVA